MIGLKEQKVGLKEERTMRQFDYKKLSEKKWDNDILLLCSKIHECKGRQELYIRQKPAQLDYLV